MGKVWLQLGGLTAGFILLAGSGLADVQSLLDPAAPAATASGQKAATARPTKSVVGEEQWADRGARAARALAGRLQRLAMSRPPEQPPRAGGQAALRELQAELGKTVRADFAPNGKTLRQLQLKTPTTRADAPRSAARSAAAKASAGRFLARHSTLLGLQDAEQELRLEREQADDLGLDHLRYQQVYQGVPVYARELLVHVDADGEVYRVNGTYSPTPLGLDPTPVISIDEAVAAAQDHLGPVTPDAFGKAPSAALAIYPREDGSHLLVYQVVLAPQLAVSWTYFIDAGTGAFVHRITNVMQDAANSADYFGTAQDITVWPYSSGYALSDPDGSGASGQVHVLDAKSGTLKGGMAYFITNNSLSGGWDPIAVSVAHNVERTLDYYAAVHGRAGVDDRDTDVVSVVHYGAGSEAANAFWSGQLMAYGDGGDNPAIFDTPLGVGLDVVAHEFTHGVTQHTAGLYYQDQSGALNEAMSDFFAAMVDRDDWTLGEDVTGSYFPGFLRSMRDPNATGDPAHIDEYVHGPADYGGVHTNSGIPNRALYLLGDGLSAEGLGTSVGRAKAEKIVYRALAHHMTTQTQFLDARNAMLAAATELYGDGVETAAVAAAWDAVGVTDATSSGPSDSAPTDTTALTGEDLMVFLYPTDGSHDHPFDVVGERYNLHVVDPSAGTTSADLNQIAYMEYTRPAAVTTATDGTLLFYVGIDHNVYATDLDANDEAVTSTGGIWSIAVAPDAAYFAYTPDDPDDNNIYVLDVETEDLTAHPIISYSDADVAANTVLYADSLAFDYSGRKLVFDALNCVGTADSSCADGGGLRWWSVGILDVVSGEVRWPLPGQTPLFDLGYPAFAANNSYVIALAALDWTQFAATNAVTSGSLALNLQQSQILVLDDRTNGGSDPARLLWSAPSFCGDDDAVAAQRFDDSNGFAYKIPVDATWQGNPAAATLISTNLASHAAALPVMHRRAWRDVSGTIQYSATALNFGTVAPAGTAAKTLLLRNVGNRDLWVSGLAITGDGFSHNATPMPLPQDSTAAITVTFRAGSATGQQSGAITIRSDADAASQQVALVAKVGSSGGGGGGGGGGCFLDSLGRYLPTR